MCVIAKQNAVSKGSLLDCNSDSKYADKKKYTKIAYELGRLMLISF